MVERKRNWLVSSQTWITHRDQRRQSSEEKPVNCILRLSFFSPHKYKGNKHKESSVMWTLLVSLAADNPTSYVAKIMSKVANFYLFLKLVAILICVHFRETLIYSAHHQPKTKDFSLSN